MSAYEILPLLVFTDAWFLQVAGAFLGRLKLRFSLPSRAALPAARRIAFNPAERFLPCHRLSIGIPRH
jgi:hypothetical protein